MAKSTLAHLIEALLPNTHREIFYQGYDTHRKNAVSQAQAQEAPLRAAVEKWHNAAMDAGVIILADGRLSFPLIDELAAYRAKAARTRGADGRFTAGQPKPANPPRQRGPNGQFIKSRLAADPT